MANTIVETVKSALVDLTDPKPNLEWFDQRVTALQKMNKLRNDFFDRIDRAEHQDWELPAELKQQWIIKATEPRFGQAIEAGKKIVSKKKARIHFAPYESTDASRKLADRHEKAAEWLWGQASRRREATLLEDYGHSAFKYAEICAQVVFMPQQVKEMKAKGQINSNREKAMERKGPFVVDVHDARDVFPRYSPYGLEEVALVTDEAVEDVIHTWGDSAKELSVEVGLWNSAQNSDTAKIHTCKLVDFVNYQWRGVYVIAGFGNESRKIELMIERWKWPFLPWVCRFSGTSMETRSDRKRRPILTHAIEGNLDELLPRVRTLRFSDRLRYSASPRRAFSSSRRKSPDIDQLSPDLTVHIYDDEGMVPLDPPMPDPGMETLYSEVSADHQRSTFSDILLGGEIPSQAAFASINLVTHSAMGAVNPFTHLMNNAIADTIELMFLWSHYSGIPVVGYEVDADGKRIEHMINPEEIQPKSMYITAEVRSDLPTDDQAKAALVGMLIDRRVMSRRQGAEYMGQENVQENELQLSLEAMMDAMLQTELKNIALMGDMQARQQLEEEIMRTKIQPMLQELAARMQQQQGPPQDSGARPVPPDAMAGGGRQLPQREMPPTGIPSEANPAEGGPPGAMFNPGATREGQTGQAPGGADMI